MAKRSTKWPLSWQGTRWIALFLLIFSSNFWFNSLDSWKEEAGGKSARVVAQSLFEPKLLVAILFLLHFIVYLHFLSQIFTSSLYSR